MIERLFTIGVFGKTQDQFFQELVQARIHTFCDIRRRRGVRGSQYSFVNSKRLQHLLAEQGIAYRYFPELAPTKEMREAQHAIDAQQGIPKRMREELGEEFKSRYIEGILSHFDSQRFAQDFDSSVSIIVLFCVEGNPKACHRSLVAERLRREWGIPVEHI
jgi:uncharacterized protein (DUF488 family)